MNFDTYMAPQSTSVSTQQLEFHDLNIFFLKKRVTRNLIKEADIEIRTYMYILS